jgi:hypothetical protein
VPLTVHEANALLESIKYSKERIRDWHARLGKPEWCESTLEPLESAETKLRDAKRGPAK